MARFLVGLPECQVKGVACTTRELQREDQLTYEMRTRGDIIRVNASDAYEYLAAKTLAFFKWTSSLNVKYGLFLFVRE